MIVQQVHPAMQCVQRIGTRFTAQAASQHRFLSLIGRKRFGLLGARMPRLPLVMGFDPRLRVSEMVKVRKTPLLKRLHRLIDDLFQTFSLASRPECPAVGSGVGVGVGEARATVTLLGRRSR